MARKALANSLATCMTSARLLASAGLTGALLAASGPAHAATSSSPPRVAAPSRLVRPPHVHGASAVLECVVTEIMSPRSRSGEPVGSIMVIGEVVGVHVDERFLTDGLFDLTHVRPVARLGYMDYATVTEAWAMRRPRWKDRDR